MEKKSRLMYEVGQGQKSRHDRGEKGKTEKVFWLSNYLKDVEEGMIEERESIRLDRRWNFICWGATSLWERSLNLTYEVR